MIFITGKKDSGRKKQLKEFVLEKNKSNGDKLTKDDVFYLSEYIVSRSREYKHGMGKERCDGVTNDIVREINAKIDSGVEIVVAEEMGCCISPMAKSAKMAIEVNASVCIEVAKKANEAYLSVDGKSIRIK